MSEVYTYSPIVHGEKTFPDWWKKLEKNVQIHPMHTPYKFGRTMKTCVGFTDFFINSVSLRLHTDVYLTMAKNKIGDSLGYTGLKMDNINPNFRWVAKSSSKAIIEEHAPEQYGDFIDIKEQQHMKLVSPWLFECKEDIPWVSVGNCWNEKLVNKITVLSGILNFKYQSTTNINFITSYPKEDIETIFLPFGTNLVNFFPLSDRKVKIHNHLISENEFYRKNATTTPQIFFVNGYNKLKKIKQENESKCPFGFKK